MFLGLFGIAIAQSTPASTPSSGFNLESLTSFVPIALIGVVMYFFVIRPQQKKLKQHADMISTLNRGDRVITTGGIVGHIHKVGSQNEITLEIAENVRIKILKTAIGQVVAKGDALNVYDDVEHGVTIIEPATAGLSTNSDKIQKAVRVAKPRSKKI